MASKPVRYTTPIGIAKFPRLNKPETEINGKPTKPKYKITVVITADEAEAFRKPLEDARAVAFAAAKKNPKTKKIEQVDLPLKQHTVTDGDEVKEVEGMIELTAKTAAEFEDKKTGETIKRRVPLFDAKGIPIKVTPNIGSGSKVKVAFTVGGYERPVKTGIVEVGACLYLEAVQLIDLVEFGGGNAEAYGFGAEEGFDGTTSMPETEGSTTEEEPTGKSTGSATDY